MQEEAGAVPERLRAAKRLAVGVKQTLKAVQVGAASTVYVASDAEERVVVRSV